MKKLMNEDLIPVLVGAGQYVERESTASSSTPIEMMVEAARLAMQDGGAKQIVKTIDCVTAVGLTVDEAQVKTPVSGMYKNVPKSVADSLGVDARRLIYTETGGNTPQRLVNYFAEQIASGQVGTVLLTGGEALNTMAKRFNHWSKLLLPKGRWRDNPGGTPERFGESRAGSSSMENRYAMNLPAKVYPLFENALCAHYQRQPEEHRQHIGELFSRLTAVAANNPYAWFQKKRSTEELITVGSNNRMVSYPYTKLLNSMISVNQSAAVIMTSVAKAKALGISQDKWVYLHGAGDANDIWNVSERSNFHSSPGMNAAAQSALQMASKGIDDMGFFDIYSCFPSAVQIACDEFGIAHDDSRGLTLTGGLPYFGGPGNNYSMHGIVEMVHRARENSNDYGLLNANGWYLTKHSVGIYSCVKPKSVSYARKFSESELPTIQLIERAQGLASIETYTVIHDKDNIPKRATIIGRLKTGERFLASCEKQGFNELLKTQCVGRIGQVTPIKGENIFEFN